MVTMPETEKKIRKRGHSWLESDKVRKCTKNDYVEMKVKNVYPKIRLMQDEPKLAVLRR